MDTVTLKRGEGMITLKKLPEYFAMRLKRGRAAHGMTLEACCGRPPTEIRHVHSAPAANMEVFRVEETKKLEQAMEQLREAPAGDVVSHVYALDETAGAAVIPTGTMTVQFRADVPEEQRQELLAEHGLEVVEGSGRLRSAGEYLSVIDVAAVEDGVSALGEAKLSGQIDGAVDIVAEATLSRATLSSPVPDILPVRAMIEHASINSVDLAELIGRRGRAGLAFRVDADSALEVAGYRLWEQSWSLGRFNAGIGWSGGLKYSPNPGVDWDLGALGREDELDLGPADDDAYFDTGFREDSAEIEEDDVIDAILNDTNAQVAAPTGLSEDEPLPFTWHKVLDLYPRRLDIPRAEDPVELDRDAGPTTVRYLTSGRSVYQDIGVASDNWPHQGKTFDYFPHPEREEPEKTRLRELLTRLGYNRSGTDVDRVHERQFGGADHFENLWPAENSMNRSAGTRHLQQLQNYQAQLGNIAGRWVVIARIRI